MLQKILAEVAPLKRQLAEMAVTLNILVEKVANISKSEEEPVCMDLFCEVPIKSIEHVVILNENLKNQNNQNNMVSVLHLIKK